ncbi:hypothetical protein [Sphingobium sp. Sx8-8]|uniref:hypothetical protein n=1 Tax=Sphingobium sp. Sx8-8 TaxID=2933617 RepID=UPI001F5814E9|nr:hypothetical protein [Sphingobium sp. Sx8-8]
MRLDAKTIWTTLLVTGCMALTGCGSKKETGTAVPMNHMEVVDGTASDAMTDLDGVQSEGTAMTLPANRSENSSAPAAAPKEQDAQKPAADTEVLSDQ